MTLTRIGVVRRGQTLYTPPVSTSPAPARPPTEPFPGPVSCFSAITAPELYRNFAIHLFVMFPAAMVMCAIAHEMDQRLGLPELMPQAAATPVGLALIGAGGLWVWYVYGYLFRAGAGSPGTHVDGGPTVMVDTGPYAAIRHPSVLGKLAGVIGLGIIWNSITFEAGFVPVLVVYSLVTNRYLQERFCEERFGEKYQIYRARVPMLLPRPSGIKRWLDGAHAVPEDTVRGVSAHPPTIMVAFRYYLVGLVLLI